VCEISTAKNLIYNILTKIHLDLMKTEHCEVKVHRIAVDFGHVILSVLVGIYTESRQ